MIDRMERTLAEVLGQAYQFPEVTPMEFYTDIFRLGEGLIQSENGAKHDRTTNPVIYWKNESEQHGRYRIMFEDTFSATLQEAQQADFAIMNGLTYWGRKNEQAKAQRMFALMFDLDGQTPGTLYNFLYSALSEVPAYPLPNYINLSGHNVHLVYVLEEPVNLYPGTKLELKKLKYALIDKMWNPFTSTEKKPQKQGINQGFRPVGGKTKIPGVAVRSFRISSHPVTVDYLNQFVLPEYQANMSVLRKESKYTQADAKKRFPEWWAKVCRRSEIEAELKKDLPDDQRQKLELEKAEIDTRKYWKVKKDLYAWWLVQIKQGAAFRHRYFCIMALFIYAVKCGVDESEAMQDAKNLIPFLTSLNPSEPFTEADVMSAYESYDLRFCTFPRQEISELTAIQIKENKRNHRKQSDHLQSDFWINDKGRRQINVCKQNRELALQDMRDAGEITGRPSKYLDLDEYYKTPEHKQKLPSPTQAARDLKISRTTVYEYLHRKAVEDWQVENPGGTKETCQTETGLSPETVKKFWNNRN